MFLSLGGHPRGDNDQINQYDDNGEWVLVLVSSHLRTGYTS